MGKNNQKRTKAYYRKCGKNSKKQGKMLQCGMQGVLITCSGDEPKCVREAYNILNEYADQIYGPEIAQNEENDNSDEDSDEDIADSLQREVNALNEQHQKKEKRFRSVRTGAKNVVFIQTTGVDPHKVMHGILTDLETTGTQKTRFIQRMLPISHTCKPFEDAIEKAAKEMIDDVFNAPEAKPSSFCVMFKSRNNSNIHRDWTIRQMASMVMQESILEHKVDLNNPDHTILVEVIGGVCCLSVLEAYGRFRKYNLHLVAKGDDRAAQDGKEKNSTEKGGDGAVAQDGKRKRTSDGADGGSANDGVDEGQAEVKRSKVEGSEEGVDGMETSEKNNHLASQDGSSKRTGDDAEGASASDRIDQGQADVQRSKVEGSSEDVTSISSHNEGPTDSSSMLKDESHALDDGKGDGVCNLQDLANVGEQTASKDATSDETSTSHPETAHTLGGDDCESK